MPTDFHEALHYNHEAGQIFPELSPSHQQEYIRWIEEAKKDETRQRRIQKALEMILKLHQDKHET